MIMVSIGMWWIGYSHPPLPCLPPTNAEVRWGSGSDHTGDKTARYRINPLRADGNAVRYVKSIWNLFKTYQFYWIVLTDCNHRSCCYLVLCVSCGQDWDPKMRSMNGLLLLNMYLRFWIATSVEVISIPHTEVTYFTSVKNTVTSLCKYRISV